LGRGAYSYRRNGYSVTVNRFKDFDAAWSESTQAPLSVKVFGKTYDLPAKLPAKVVIVIARAKAGHAANEDVPLEMVMAMLEPFFGAKTLDIWLEAGIDIDQLGDVFKWSMQVYQGNDPDAKDPDEDTEGVEGPKD
jgi:hypothetical protein